MRHSPGCTAGEEVPGHGTELVIRDTESQECGSYNLSKSAASGEQQSADE